MTHENHIAAGDRNLRTSMLRGWKRRCPACGQGHLMQSYLTVAENCESCGEELFHQRADDGPAWATILIAGHVMASIMLLVFELWRPDPWVMAIGLSSVFLAVALYLLPRLKGVFVGIQWAKRMHGFGGERDLATGA